MQNDTQSSNTSIENHSTSKSECEALEALQEKVLSDLQPTFDMLKQWGGGSFIESQ